MLMRIISLGMRLMAKRAFVGVCKAAKTVPNFPYPSCLVSLNWLSFEAYLDVQKEET